MIESYGITAVRTNRDAADFNINKLINQIYMHIIKSTKKQTQKTSNNSLFDDLWKDLFSGSTIALKSERKKRIKAHKKDR